MSKMSCYNCKQLYTEKIRKKICNTCLEIKEQLENFLKSKFARVKVKNLIDILEHGYFTHSYKDAIIVEAGKDRNDQLLSWDDYIYTIRRYAIKLSERGVLPPYYILTNHIIITEAQLYYEKNDINIYEYFLQKKYIKDWIPSISLVFDKEKKHHRIALVSQSNINTIWSDRSITFSKNPSIIMSGDLLIQNNRK